jgi:catechol 2,3-dioxygenase-like lactoylglutathione lyase family enzyme
MFSHIMVGANDVQESKIFYDAILGSLGHESGLVDDKGRCFYRTNSGTFAIGEPAYHGNGITIGFSAENSATVDAWHSAGIANGGTSCENPPGLRGGANLYIAYLRDPSGNKICALYR